MRVKASPNSAACSTVTTWPPAASAMPGWSARSWSGVCRATKEVAIGVLDSRSMTRLGGAVAGGVGTVGQHHEGAGAAAGGELGDAAVDAVEQGGAAGGDEPVDRGLQGGPVGGEGVLDHGTSRRSSPARPGRRSAASGAGRRPRPWPGPIGSPAMEPDTSMATTTFSSLERRRTTLTLRSSPSSSDGERRLGVTGDGRSGHDGADQREAAGVDAADLDALGLGGDGCGGDQQQRGEAEQAGEQPSGVRDRALIRSLLRRCVPRTRCPAPGCGPRSGAGSRWAAARRAPDRWRRGPASSRSRRWA